jgi:DNA mismatch repair protein MutS2
MDTKSMRFEPREVPLRLEFDRILALVEKHTLTPMGAERVRLIVPMLDFERIDTALREAREYKLLLEKNERLPLEIFSDLRPTLRLLAVPDYTLPLEGFQNIRRVLVLVRGVFRFFAGPKKEIYPKLYAPIAHLPNEEHLLQAIDAVLDDKGNVRPDASPELLRIRREQQQKMRELDTRFRHLVAEYRNKGWLSDAPESIRNGRRVLAVPAEYRRNIRGILHDESDTGRTVFIEPEPVIEINNDLFDLEAEERREIFRILRQLSQDIRPHGEVMALYQDALVRLEVIQAKALLALELRANMPILRPKPVISIRKGYHPLLYLKNKAAGKKTVPFDLRLYPENHILVLSGPNAGGKSVVMKSVGLIQLMVQSGLLVPVHELSELGLFEQVFADIGDQQSLDDGLSTYSSRLQNARLFIQRATPNTLVLIDEMGSGTDPKPGGAIAEAILQELYRKGVYAVITTHYSNLKVFAFRHQGILNGCMQFDKDTLSPTYELKVGRPGSSYAFEIAAKSGLPKHLIDYARKRTGSETAVDDILVELQREKQEVEELLRALREKEQNLDRLIKTYDSLHHDLELRRKRLKLDQKEFELRISANASREVEKIVRQLRQEKNLERAQQVAEQLRQTRAETAQQIDDIYAQVVQLEEKKPVASARSFQVGDYARLRAGGATGRIESIEDGKARVVMGGITVTANVRDLLPVAPTAERSASAVTTDIQKTAHFENKIDIRGMVPDEAMRVLEKFVDNALLANATTLRILHGKGVGVLRRVVKEKLREYGHHIARTYHPEPELGGDGVTIVELA